MVWLIDMFRCDDLRHIREATGMPAGFVLELHGWWVNFVLYEGNADGDAGGMF
jgi:hypothetical protein